MFSWRLQIETNIAIQPKIWEKMSICDCLDLTKLNIYISKRGLFSVLSNTVAKYSYSCAFYNAALIQNT